MLWVTYLCLPCPAFVPRLVLAQNKKELLTNWWNEGKLEASEDLGDLVSAAGGFKQGVGGAEVGVAEGAGVSSRWALRQQRMGLLSAVDGVVFVLTSL